MGKWCIGLDLGGTFTKAVALDEQRRATELVEMPTPASRDKIVKGMIDGAKELMKREGLSSDNVLGVGIGAPGPLKISEGIVLAMPNIPGMENFPIARELSEALSIPTVLENDANAAAYAEFLCGAGQSDGDMVLLTIGTGIGSGIIINGEILHGVHEMAAELGHIIVVPDGEQCGCGQRGCLERYCSATYIAEYAKRRIIRDGCDSLLKTLLESKGSIDAKDINDARRAGDALATEVWDQAARFLALASVNLCRVFDPERIVFAGGMTKAGEDLMMPLREHFDRLHWKISDKLTRLVLAELGHAAGAIGSAGVAWKVFGGGER